MQILGYRRFPGLYYHRLTRYGVRQNLKKIGVSLLKHAMAAFRTNIWIPRCTLTQNEKSDLVSQLGIKGPTPSITTTTHLDLYKVHQANISFFWIGENEIGRWVLPNG